MRVLMHSTYATPTASAAAGDVIDLPHKVAQDLIEKGYASRESDSTRLRVPTPSEETSSVPSGSIKKVLTWVGDDPARAAAALTHELARSKPRPTLLETLTPIAATTEEE